MITTTRNTIETFDMEVLEQKKNRWVSSDTPFRSSYSTIYDNHIYLVTEEGIIYSNKIPKFSKVSKLPKKAIYSSSAFNFVDNIDDFVDGEYTVYGEEYPENCIELSFNCLGRLILIDSDDATDLEVSIIAGEALAKGEAKIMDFTKSDNNETEELENKVIDWCEKEGISRGELSYSHISRIRTEIKSSKAGYTLIIGPSYSCWHSPGYVLVAYTQEGYKTRYFILGQDDDSYFGCELPKRVYTVEEALKCLIPEEVKGKNYVRQGEWFIAQDSDIPEIEECLCLFTGGGNVGPSRESNSDEDRTEETARVYDGLALPVDSPSSSRHYISTTIGESEVRVDYNGQIYATNFRLVHNRGDHPEVGLDDNKWYTFYCNTALNSVSLDGVD